MIFHLLTHSMYISTPLNAAEDCNESLQHKSLRKLVCQGGEMYLECYFEFSLAAMAPCQDSTLPTQCSGVLRLFLV